MLVLAPARATRQRHVGRLLSLVRTLAVGMAGGLSHRDVVQALAEAGLAPPQQGRALALVEWERDRLASARRRTVKV